MLGTASGLDQQTWAVDIRSIEAKVWRLPKPRKLSPPRKYQKTKTYLKIVSVQFKKQTEIIKNATFYIDI